MEFDTVIWYNGWNRGGDLTYIRNFFRILNIDYICGALYNL